jgi:hypothetical protein
MASEPTKRTPHHRPPANDPQTGRAHGSPLGGQIFTEVRNNQQIEQERRNRAQSPRPADKKPGRAR